MILEQEGFPALGIVGIGAFKPEWVPQLEPFQVHLALDLRRAGRPSATQSGRMMWEQRDFGEGLPVSKLAGLRGSNGPRGQRPLSLKFTKAKFYGIANFRYHDVVFCWPQLPKIVYCNS